MIRLALAAPSAMLLAGLEALVMRDGDFTVVERIAHLDDIAETLAGADVDVVVAVVGAPSTFAMATPGSEDPTAHRWILLLDADAYAAGEWLRRGARAVLPRDAEASEILAAIEAVHAGLAVVTASAIDALSARRARDSVRLATALAHSPLSPREREILALLAEGLGNKVVAARLGISEHTVKTHVASIFQKLGADTRAEAVAIGARTGVILL